MKYWRGYLVAVIMAAITWALVEFARTHSVLIDMVYPYMTRLVVTSMANWTSGMAFCLWQVLLIGLVVVGMVTVILMILLKWNFFQWLGWVLAAVSCVVLLNTGIYGLNQYASPLADDMRLEITDYTVSELNEATIYFRDKANELAATVKRDEKGLADPGSFEEAAVKAGEGFRVLTYEDAISVFAGSTVPVKKLGWSGLYSGRFGKTVPLTGEAAVNPNVPGPVLPFAICNEMCHRMSIYSDADAAFGAFLACIENPDPNFQYAGYMMAYYYCYSAITRIPTSTAQAAATQTDKGVSAKLRADLEAYIDFFGEGTIPENNRAEITEELADKNAPISYSCYDDASQLLANWYIQKFIVPLHVEEETPFNPLDPSQVDLTGLTNAPKK